MDDFVKISSTIINYSGLLFSIGSTVLMFYFAWNNKHHFHANARLIYVTALMFVMSFLRYIVLYDTERVTEFSQYRGAKQLVITMTYLNIIQMLMYYVIFLTTLLIITYYVLFNEITALLLWVFVLLTFVIISIHIETVSIMNNESIQMMISGQVFY